MNKEEKQIKESRFLTEKEIETVKPIIFISIITKLTEVSLKES